VIYADGDDGADEKRERHAAESDPQGLTFARLIAAFPSIPIISRTLPRVGDHLRNDARETCNPLAPVP
jgi:hypothetical protein